MTFGLVPTGFRAKRALDVRDSLRARYVDALVARGLPPDVDWSRDTVAGALIDALAVEIAEPWSAAQAVYDAHDPAAAVDAALDNLGALRSLPRLPATRSRAEVELTGAIGVIVPSGSLVRGGGPDGRALWRTIADTTLAAGPVPAEVEAVERGAIAAAPGDIDDIVTTIENWFGVTNPAAAITGRDRESNADYRRRLSASPTPPGGRSVAALRATLLGLSGLQSVTILENVGPTPLVVSARTLEPHSILPVLWPATLTPSQQEAVAAAIFDFDVGGRRCGRIGGDVELTVEAEGVDPTVIGWDWAAEDTIPVVVTVALAPGVTLGEVTPGVEAAAARVEAALDVGQPARLLRLMAEIAQVDGIDGAAITLDGVAADYTPDRYEIVRFAVSVTT